MKKSTTGPIIIIALCIALCIVAYDNHIAKSNHLEQKSVNYTPQQSIIQPTSESHIDTSERDDMVNVQVLFAQKGYQYCEFYDEYKQWEAEANKMDDDYYQSHPDAPGIGAKRADRWLDIKISRWLKKHNLPDSLSNTIAIYGNKVCN